MRPSGETVRTINLAHMSQSRSLIGAGFNGPAIVAASLATAAPKRVVAILFAGRPDPRLKASLTGRTSIKTKGRDAQGALMFDYRLW
jgi:hypothetical protein